MNNGNDAPAGNSPTQGTKETPTDFASGFTTQVPKEVYKLAQHGASCALMGLGTAMLLVALCLRFRPWEKEVPELQAIEFIVVTILAVAVILAGAGLRHYQDRAVRETSRELLRSWTRMHERRKESTQTQE